ncbi:hypothetical protein FVEN_g11899 [Fusarium venenatum]|uniref:Restriction of telomere capping protein 4 n=1 Tax=Fusarium venenatum TaxID=56646 RepID=A0A2L2T5D1_9HYPO|nr:uncharacterized protein FVRRES_01550 [Fusarium venenatum]KAG8349938.1 hypothetical protein FVEN_g11899 [Fusarium venenatum]KAH7005281.1 RTC4-like domain-containing protein [Fusarium venenatum]CEI65038.1 unnamed protein product [Fusarium venenatum]
MNPRIVGMSKHSKPATLLSTFNANVNKKQKQKLQQEPEDFTAPPVSSGDEDEGEDKEETPPVADLKLRSSRAKNHTISDSDDSGPERSNRGNIKRTNFPTSSAGKSREKTGRGTEKRASEQSTAEDTEETSSSSSKRRRVASESRDDPANHFKDTRGFTKSSNSKVKYGYFKSGKGPQASRGSQAFRGSQDSQTKKGKGNGKERKTLTEQDGNDDLLNSPPNKDKATFKLVPRGSLTPPKLESKKRKLNVPLDDLGSPKKQVGSTMISPSRENACSSQDKKGGPTSASQESSSRERGVFRVPEMIKNKKPKKKERSPTPEYKPATFINPVDIDSDFDLEGDNADSVSSPILSDLDQLSDTESNEIPPEDEKSLEERMAKCPWCGDAVSEQSLKDYSKGKRLNVRMQTRFCAKHKKETAMDTWRERCYPHIDWDRFEKRLEDHQQYLAKIVDGKESHYRNMLAEKIQTGQARSLKKEGDLNPGYYGPRGCKVMCDYLVEEFGESLKDNATKDRVIAGRGSAAFIQSVLVAELAVQLIMEDMNVNAREAREIMEESKTLGELLHEEI